MPSTSTVVLFIAQCSCQIVHSWKVLTSRCSSRCKNSLFITHQSQLLSDSALFWLCIGRREVNSTLLESQPSHDVSFVCVALSSGLLEVKKLAAQGALESLWRVVINLLSIWIVCRQNLLFPVYILFNNQTVKRWLSVDWVCDMFSPNNAPTTTWVSFVMKDEKGAVTRTAMYSLPVFKILKATF